MEHVNVMLNDTVDYKIVFIPQLYLSKVRPRLKMKLNKKLKIANQKEKREHIVKIKHAYSCIHTDINII